MASSGGREIERILSGGVPDSTERRLAAITGGAAFSSTLTVPEYALARDAELEPIAQLTGISACRQARGIVQTTRRGAGRRKPGEARLLTEEGENRTWTEARHKALRRLSDQAAAVGAHAVVATQCERRATLAGSIATAEMMFSGTAVRLPREWRSESPVLSTLSLQDQWCLWRAGVEPAGIVGSTVLVSVVLGRSSARALKRLPWNAESTPLDDVTEGAYEARRLAVERLEAEASALDATGVLGIRLQEERERPGGAYGAFLFKLHLLATAIRGRPKRPMHPLPVLAAR